MRCCRAELEKCYNFTELAVQLNELEAGVAPTDSRLRPDQRLMELGDWDDANTCKVLLEEKQRAARRQRERLMEDAAALGLTPHTATLTPTLTPPTLTPTLTPTRQHKVSLPTLTLPTHTDSTDTVNTDTPRGLTLTVLTLSILIPRGLTLIVLTLSTLTPRGLTLTLSCSQTRSDVMSDVQTTLHTSGRLHL